MGERTYEEHIEWCKQRAMEYYNAGDLNGAAQSMMCDLMRHPETQTIHPAILVLGAMRAACHDDDGVRKWIQGFR